MMNTTLPQNSKHDNILKIAVLGLGSVGKTTISKSYSGELDDPNQISMTKGVDITVKRTVYQGRTVTLQIWDFAGQKQFRFMIDVFLRGVKGVMYVYDITDIETLAYLNEFVDLTRNYLANHFYPKIPEVLVGNKLDLEDSEVSIEDIHDFMKNYNIKKHFLVSGLLSGNVSEPFEYIVDQIINKEQSLADELVSKYQSF
ncbi:MAG: GTP-binding protein [Candidatus Heimdallarchaeota archaeon]|nr:GTP-binding protein [Candidatus Heimdallarchaeota archaeon]MCK5142150.1 GTP-binding protein [Candidatus Heimdallarchaeota archaeon]